MVLSTTQKSRKKNAILSVLSSKKYLCRGKMSIPHGFWIQGGTASLIYGQRDWHEENGGQYFVIHGIKAEKMRIIDKS